MDGKSFKELIIWQKGMDLAVNVYILCRDFPEDEKFNLISQVKRSASSIPANISEGFGRQSNKSFSQFLKVSRGSLCELETHLILADQLNYISNLDLFTSVKNLIVEEGKMLNAFIKKLDD